MWQFSLRELAIYGFFTLGALCLLAGVALAVLWLLVTRSCSACGRRYKAWLADCPHCGFQPTAHVSRKRILDTLSSREQPNADTGIRHAFLAFDDGKRSIHYPIKLLASTYIGRSERCDIVIADAGISGTHCRVEHRPDGFRVYDLKSTNGTFLNGARIEKSEINHGDKLRVGRTHLTFLVEKTGSPFGRL